MDTPSPIQPIQNNASYTTVRNSGRKLTEKANKAPAIKINDLMNSCRYALAKARSRWIDSISRVLRCLATRVSLRSWANRTAIFKMHAVADAVGTEISAPGKAISFEDWNK